MRKACKNVAWSEGKRKLTVLCVDGRTLLKRYGVRALSRLKRRRIARLAARYCKCSIELSDYKKGKEFLS